MSVYKKYIVIIFLLLNTSFLCLAQEEEVKEDPLSYYYESAAEKDSVKPYDKYRLPSIGIGIGVLPFFGDIGTSESKIPGIGRINTGFDFNVEQRINNTFSASLNGLFGKLSGNDNDPYHHFNFSTKISQINTNIIVHLDNDSIINKTSRFAPFISLGLGFMSFNPYTDLCDENGKQYYYWENGKIMDQAFDQENPQNGNVLVRDYVYETKLDKNNKYSHHTLTIPIGIGLKFKLTEQFETKISSVYYLTKTDYIDNKSFKDKNYGFFSGHNDSYLYTSVSLLFNISGKPVGYLSRRYYKDVNFREIEEMDLDADGVKDDNDLCPDTPKDAKVDENGCPLDDDSDGVPNYIDKEQNTPAGNLVDENGVTITQKMIEDRYLRDSLIMAGLIVPDRDSSMLNQPDFNVTNVEYKETKTEPTPSIVNDVIYRIQIASLENDTSKSRFQSYLKDEYMSEEVFVSPYQGRYLYSVGTFNSLGEAEEFNNDFEDKTGLSSFVIAFKDGKKIGVEQVDELINVKKEENINNIPEHKKEIVRHETETNKEKLSVVPSSVKKNIIYKVQIASLNNNTSKQYFQSYLKNEYGVSEDIFVNPYQGRYLYSVGTFNSLDEAKKFKNDFENKTELSSFVIVFKDGEKIDIEQADKLIKENKKDISASSIKGVIYRVQIASLNNDKTKSLFKNKYNITDKIFVDYYKGAYKYSVGTFYSYTDANNYSNDLKTKTDVNSFVIAFKDGKRISFEDIYRLKKINNVKEDKKSNVLTIPVEKNEEKNKKQEYSPPKTDSTSIQIEKNIDKDKKFEEQETDNTVEEKNTEPEQPVDKSLEINNEDVNEKDIEIEKTDDKKLEANNKNINKKEVEPEKATDKIELSETTNESNEVIYRVDFAYLRNDTSAFYFQNEYFITEKIYIIPYHKKYIYSVGTFKSIDKAKEFKREFGKKTGLDAYIDAFKGKQLITLKQAKNIENQKNVGKSLETNNENINKKDTEPEKPVDKILEDNNEKETEAEKATDKIELSETTNESNEVVYRINFASLRNDTSTFYFQNEYFITEKIFITSSHKRYIYSVGSFKSIDKAKEFKREFRKKTGLDTYIGAFKGKQPITLKQAKNIENKETDN